MADLNARSDSFIGLLLDVSGRARPSDLTGMSAEEAAALLQTYASAHPERQLRFDGAELSPAPAPVAAPVAEPAVPSWEAPVAAPVSPYDAVPAPDVYDAPVAPVDPYAAQAQAAVSPELNPELPSWIYDHPQDEAATPVAPVGDFGAPVQPAVESFAPAPMPASVDPAAPGPDFEAQLLADVEEDLPEAPGARAKKRSSLSVSPLILVLLAVVVVAAVAVGVLGYLGILPIFGTAPTPPPVANPVPNAVPTATPDATASTPATPAP